MEPNFKVNMNEYLPLRDVVFNTLRQAILRGELKPGERLMEIQLANKLGVSRTPIREAIRKLELEGLVLMIPRKGAEVAEITEKNMRDVLEVRKALEELAVQLACEKITEEEIQNLEKIQEEYKKIVSQDSIDAIEVYQQNRLYHFSIYKASQLDRVCSMIESLWDNLSFFKLVYGQKLLLKEESRRNMIAEHDSYLEALKNHDSELIYHLLGKNLKKRTEDIPYSSSAYFHEEA